MSQRQMQENQQEMNIKMSVLTVVQEDKAMNKTMFLIHLFFF